MDLRKIIPIWNSIVFRQERNASQTILTELDTNADGAIVPGSNGRLVRDLETALDNPISEVIHVGTPVTTPLINQAAARAAPLAVTRARDYFRDRQRAQEQYNKTHGKWAWTKQLAPYV